MKGDVDVDMKQMFSRFVNFVHFSKCVLHFENNGLPVACLWSVVCPLAQ